MPWDGSGKFTQSKANYVAGTTIDPSVVNAEIDNIVAGIDVALTKNGQNTPTVNLPMGGFRHTGVDDAVADTDYAAWGQVKGAVADITYTGSAKPSGPGTTTVDGALDEAYSRLAKVTRLTDFAGLNADGTTDDQSVFQSFANAGGFLYIPAGTYKIVGEVTFGSDTHVLVEAGTEFILDCSGENGRGFFFKEAINSGMRGDFKITASATSLGTDGSKNSCIQFGNDAGDATPSITQHCYLRGEIDIEITGANNVKHVYLAGWVEDFDCEGVRMTGMSNFCFTAHWTKDVASGLPAKTWHAHNIRVRNCRVYQKSGFDKPLRGFTFSAAGRVVMEDCDADVQTLSYNLFVGDYGYTYAQNITELEAYDFSLNGVKHYGGDNALSADCQSAGVDSSPVWNGFDHRARVLVRDFEVDANDSTDGLMIALTGLDRGVFELVDMHSTSVTHTRELFYAQLCNTVKVIGGQFVHHEWMRFATTTYVTVDGAFIGKPAATPDATSFALTAVGVDFLKVLNCTITDARIGIQSVDAHDKSITISGNTFEQIGLNCIDVNNSNQLLIGNNTFKNVGTTTTTAAISLILLDVAVTGVAIWGNVFDDNEARYLIHLDNVTDGTIYGNLFLDLDTGKTSPAAVFDGTTTNVLVDTSTNIVASGITLVHDP